MFSSNKMDEKPDISVIIPCKNGGKYLKGTLGAVLSQDTKYSYEIIAIDSGSSDNTLDILRSFPKVHLVQIKPEDFHHGRTRNLGAELSKGRLLIFLNQDAAPADRDWLDQLIEPFLKDDPVAGAYSRQLPREDCYAFVKGAICENFPGTSRVVRPADYRSASEKSDYLKQRELVMFSTVSAAIRKEVWEKRRFDNERDFAEDQAWAKEVLENGYSIAYNSGSRVYHSHNYSFLQWFNMKYISFISFSVIFKKRLLNLLLILPFFLKSNTATLIFILKQGYPPGRSAREMIRGSLAHLVCLSAQICAAFSLLFGRRMKNYVK